MADTMTRPMGVLDATALREIELWREHELVANALGAVQRRAHSGHSTPGDEALHRNLISQLELIETAIIATEAEQGAEIGERLQAFVRSLQQDIEARVGARDRDRLTTNVMRGVA